jgi:hypothetical protein
MSSPVDSYGFVSPDARIDVYRVRDYDVDEDMAADVVTIMRDAYLASPLGQVTIGEDNVRAHFDPQDQTVVDRQQERMAESIANGSNYWLAAVTPLPLNSGDTRQLGVVKTTPSRPGLRKIAGHPNAFINDLAAAPTESRVPGLGSALLYSALGDYHPKREALLNAFNYPVHPISWFSRLGFKPVDNSQTPPLQIGDTMFDQKLMGGTTVQYARTRLVMHRGWLAQGVKTDINGLTHPADPLY